MSNRIHATEIRETISLDTINRVSTTNGGITKDCNPMLYQNLSTIIRWYKGRTTFEIRKKNSGFAWQPRFYEHVVRNENEMSRISEYVVNNPLTWLTDDYYE